MSFSFHVNSDEKLLYVHGEGVPAAQDIDGYYVRLKATKGVESCVTALVNLSSPDVSVKRIPIRNIKSMDDALVWLNIPASTIPKC